MQKNNKVTLHSEQCLLTVAKIVHCEVNRINAAKKWLGSGRFSEREMFLLNGFWELLDNAPEQVEVTSSSPRHVVYK